MDTLPELRKAIKLQLAGNLPAAEEIYKQVLEQDPDSADGNHLLGLIKSDQDKNDEALELIRKAIDLKPNAAPFHHNIAGIFRRMGSLSQAEQEFRIAIELDPGYGEAYQGVSEMFTFRPGDPLLDSTLEQLQKPELSNQQKSYFHFTAGKIYDDLKIYDEAFKHYVAGNRHAHKSFDNAAFRQQVSDTIYTYNRRLAGRNSGNQDQRPVFIVGMPRSGTTLVEHIMASHSQVFGAGELNDMKFVVSSATRIGGSTLAYPHCMPMISAGGYSLLASEYRERIAKIEESHGYARVVDKHPLNFQFLGLILQMFPRATIIHTKRHPLDTCLSCFFQNFTSGQHYSFDINHLAQFYQTYDRLMEHWMQLYPGRILEVEYEALLSDQEKQTRRILDHCGLKFEDACMDFYKTDRVVKTASFLQIRQPLYRTSVGRWRNYMSHLSSVASTLGISMDQPVTVLAGSNMV